MDNKIQKTESNELQQVDPASLFISIIQAASTNGEVDADKLLKLIEAGERCDATIARKKYVVAMAQFQATAPKIIKDAQGHNSGYAKLSTVIAIVAPKLSECGLSYSWVTEQDDKSIKVACKITHIGGHSEETYLSAAADISGSKNAIQGLGSTVTYLKRYTLEAALGLAEEEQDDDGNAATQPKPKPMLNPTDIEGGFLRVVSEHFGVNADSATDKHKLMREVYEFLGHHPKNQKDVELLIKNLDASLFTTIDPAVAAENAQAAEDFNQLGLNDPKPFRYYCKACDTGNDNLNPKGLCLSCLSDNIIDRQESK